MNDQETYRGFGRQSGKGGSVGLGLTLLLIGLGIGAVTALLLAPDTGRRTRKRLRRRYEDTKDMLGDWSHQANDAWEKGSDWADETRKQVNKRVKPIRKSIFG
jgi:gas vesicle protein